MSAVVDANVLVALALNDERAPAIDRWLRDHPEDLHAPDLVRYEAASALTRAIVGGRLSDDQLPEAWDRLLGVAVTLHPFGSGPATIALARRLRRESAYDAAYIVLAQTLDTELWTLDGPLARNAAGLALRVRLLDTTQS